MKYALIDNTKTEASKGAKGVCPICGSELIAKCGEVKVNHWAHKGSRNCDPWWENETEWHRSWKNNFSSEWQEIILTDDQTGEKHIADVRTAHDLVIEFQHSHLDPLERAKRESFYKHMVWVVDGTRLKGDFPRFLKGKEDFRPTNQQGKYLVDLLGECFPSAWLGSSVPVIFDYRGLETVNDPKDMRNFLYCLFPTNQREATLFWLTRESFIDNIKNGVWFKKPQEPQIQIEKPPIMSSPNVPQRKSQQIYVRVPNVRRRRF